MPDLRGLVRDALRRGGTDLLRDRGRFEELVCRKLDPESVEARLLGFGCDERYLAIFADAVDEATPGAISRAAEGACGYLRERYLLDADASLSVSSGIAGGCADFFGLPYEASGSHGRRGGHTKNGTREPSGFLKVAGIAALVCCSLALAGFLVLAHLSPVLGCTFLPTTETVDGVRCSVYTTLHAGSGDRARIVFLENEGGRSVEVVAKGSCRDEMTPAVGLYLEPGDKGIYFVGSGNGAYGIVVRDLSTNGPYQENKRDLAENLRWRCGTGEDGRTTIEIVSASPDEIGWGVGGSIVLASHGAFASVKHCRASGNIEPGVNSFEASLFRDYLYVWRPLEVSDEVDLYVNGVLIPHE